MNEQLVDRFGRVHRDLRISLTDRCSLRCTYCMPAEGVPWLARSTMLSTEEIVHVARVGVSLGITEIRLTGGEPLLRVDIVDVVRRLTALTGPAGSPEVSLTTNALRLPGLASDLKDAGLSRVNISLDTLDRAKFLELTRRDKLVETLAGIAAADAAGLHPVKINAVAMRGVNDDEVVALTRFAVDRGYQMRFIEQMPLDAGHTWDRARDGDAGGDPGAADARSSRSTEVPGRGAAPAELWTVDGGPATVGVIASVTAAVLRRVRPAAPHRRRPAARVPVLPDGDERARPAARVGRRARRRGHRDRARAGAPDRHDGPRPARTRRGRRRHRPRRRVPPVPGGQEGRARHRRPELPAARPPDERDRRLTGRTAGERGQHVQGRPRGHRVVAVDAGAVRQQRAPAEHRSSAAPCAATIAARTCAAEPAGSCSVSTPAASAAAAK